MPAHSKDLTKRTTLRHTTAEGDIVAKVVRAHAEVGITISTNDAIRICIRRAATPLPDSIDIAARRYADHVAACAPCTDRLPACPDGWWLADMWGALVAAQRPATPAPAADTAEPESAPEKRPKTRPAAGGRRSLLLPTRAQTG